MRSFDEIFALAAGRHGGPEAVEAMLPQPRPAAELAALPEDRWLAQMARAIFQAGFSWKVIEAKWDGFESAFHGFDPDRLAHLPEPEFDALLTDSRIVRNGAKINAVLDNARWIVALRGEGGVGRVLGEWPGSDFAGLLERLKTEGARLGGTSGQYALRSLGRDGWVLSADVLKRLQAEGVIDGPAGSKKAQAAIQAAFNGWAEQSGRPLSQISRVLALSL